MKSARLLFSMTAVLLVAMGAWNQVGKAGASVSTQAKGVNTLDQTKQEVLDLENEWVVAEHNRDAVTLRRILDDKFVASFGAGKPYGKEAFMKGIVSSAVDPAESQALSDRAVIIDQDTAVVVGTDTERGTRKGTAYTEVARYTATYIRREGRWLALAEHMVEVPQAK